LQLIPGAFVATDSMKAWVDAFACERPVIVFEQQGHGRTPDISREMSYEQFADDAAALLCALEVERADVMGYSEGGGVALQLAIRHESLVSKLVSMSAAFRKDGWYPSVFEAIGGLSAEAFAGTPVEKAFMEHTPDAKGFDAYLKDQGLEHHRPGHQRRGDAFDREAPPTEVKHQPSTPEEAKLVGPPRNTEFTGNAQYSISPYSRRHSPSKSTSYRS
jgi:pimeloyl-ACP methyl ester carboxylesterase